MAVQSADNETLKVVVTGGGTGGHIYPALAIAGLLRENASQVLYIGNRDSLESRLVPEQGFAFESIVFSGMPRRPGFRWLQWLLSLPVAIQSAKKHLKKFQPNVVFGTGGYVAAPVLLAAKALNVPYVIHEPDAYPGLVNRLTARWASHVTGAFAESQQRLKARNFTVTGNPVRGSIGHLSRTEALQQLGLHWPPDSRILVVTGGSQGARSINNAVIESLQVLLDSGWHIIHQCGGKLYEETRASVEKMGLADHPAYCLQPFFNNMAAVWAVADLAICRAGSMTLSELYLCGIPSILVPYPFAAADHQRMNALASERAGASVVVLDVDCTSQRLLGVLNQLGNEPSRLSGMRQAASNLAHPEASRAIMTILQQATKSSK